MPNLPPDFLARATQAVQPFMVDPDEREAYLTQAFFLLEPRLYQMERTGSAMVFTTRCIRTLVEFGCFVDPVRQHSVATLAEVLKRNCGPDRQPEFDRIAMEANAACPDHADHDDGTPLHPSPPAKPRGRGTQSVETPVGQRTPTVFISYSHADSEFAQKLIADLQAAGHAVWIDTTSIKGGDQWLKAIAEGIINSYAFVLVASHQALASQYVQDEIIWARQRNKRILTAMIEDVVEDSGFFPLVSVQAIKFYDTDYTSSLARLIEGLPSPTVTAPGETPAPAQPVAVGQRALELTYLDRLRFEILLNTEKYTPLGGEAHQQARRMTSAVAPVVMHPEFALLERRGDEQREVKRFEDAVGEIRRLRRVVVLGEPGAGKTTTLWKLARELTDAAIEDPDAPIPLVIRLGKWTEDEPLERFIQRELGDLGRYLHELLDTGRAALLLDGLNEIPVSQRKRNREDKDRQVKALIERYPALLAAVSCRARDYTLDLGFDRIEIRPLDLGRIRDFIVHYLPQTGRKLFVRLVEDALVSFGEPQAKAHEMAIKFADSPAGPLKGSQEVGAYFNLETFAWAGSWRLMSEGFSRSRASFQSRDLLTLATNPYMLSMLVQVYHERGDLPANRGELFGDFVQILLAREKLIKFSRESGEAVWAEDAKALVRGLGQLAYEMQMQIARNRAAAGESDARTSFPIIEARRFLSEKQLYQAASASLLNIGNSARFTHQLLQEYFVALYMDGEIQQGRLRAKDIWRPSNWWEPTSWEEATILLAGLHTEDPTPILNWVSEANPEVAAQCIARSGVQTPPATLDRLRDAWMPRLTDLRKPVLARASVGRALGTPPPGGAMLDNRPGVGCVEVVGTTGGPLLLPDIDWVLIPDDGPWIYQEERLPWLPAFEISRYPITFAQFQTFLDDPQGWPDPRWWEGLAMPEGHNAKPGAQRFQYGNHPRENVSWFDAIAFCRWWSWRLGGGYDLSHVTDWAVRLPTVYEWEKAARGTDGREFPYVGDFDAAKGNTAETGIKMTSAVGLCPDGASPYGVLDMSGNVGQWCLTNYKHPAQDPLQEDLRTDARRMLRGGSWLNHQYDARAVDRDMYLPFNRYENFGYRVVRCKAPCP